MKLLTILFWSLTATLIGSCFHVDPAAALIAGASIGTIMSFIPMPLEIIGAGAIIDLTEKEKGFLIIIQKEMESLLTEKFKGQIDEKSFDEKMEALKSRLAEKELKELKADILKSMEDKFTANQAEFEKMQKQIDEAGVEMTKIKENGGQVKNKTVADIIAKALESDAFKNYAEKGVGTSEIIPLDLKAVTDVTGFTGAVIMPSRRGPDVSFQPPKKFDIRDVMANGSSEISTIDHITETGFTDNSGFLAENVASPESVAQFTEVTTTAKRIATHINVSKRALKNVSFLRSHLSNRFPELIADKLTNSVINGTGAGNAFDGFFNNATTFTAGSLALKVDEANTADVLAAGIARLAEITNLQGTAIFINPLDEYLLTVTKDLQGSYSENSVMVSRINGRLHINNVPVFSTFHVTQDKWLVADLSGSTSEFLEHQALTMQIATEHASNAIQNQVTFIFELEGILPIYKTFAFLKGTISTDKVLLETL